MLRPIGTPLPLGFFALAVAAAARFEIEDARRRSVLPLVRTGAGAVAVGGGPASDTR
ncbi:hypothetical protein ACVGOW_22425 [Pseudonocardia saturnea]